MSSARLSIAALVRKEIIQTTRDRRMMALLIVAPVIQTIFFGYAANLEFNHARTVMVDEDHTDESRSFAHGLSADGTFTVTTVRNVAEAQGEIQRGGAAIAVIIPRGFGDDLRSGGKARLQALIDGSDPTRGTSAGTAVEQYVVRRSVDEARARASGSLTPSVPQIALEPRLLYNPGLKSRLFMVPGTAAAILLVVTTVVMAMGLARERETGTMEQLLVTPITPIMLMVGKTIPYAIFGLLDIILILVVGNLLFDVPLRGNIGLIFLSALTYLISTLGTGLLISSLVRTQQQALMASFFFTLPAILLSGFMTPVDAMPEWIQPLTYVDPVRYFIEIVRSVLLRGATLEDVERPLALLAALSVAVLLFAAQRFRRTIA
jgi:ABC-2 type transport system permease protein